jgi:hypothetical protein
MSAVTGRDYRDMGRFAVSLLARPLARWINRSGKRKEPATSQDIRLLGRTRAQSFDESDATVLLRMYAWFWILGGSTVAMVVFSVAVAPFLNPDPAPPAAFTAVQVVFATVMISSAMFFLLAVARVTVLRIGGKSGYASNQFLRWVGTPSHLDTVIAVLWALFLVPVIFLQAAGAAG